MGEYPVSIAVVAATVVEGNTDEIGHTKCFLKKSFSFRCSLIAETPKPSKSITIIFL